ncbi:MAG: TonB-dependent hemoglobin/transferrin/lactoferrin family receptor [Symploca sp. SIO2G7]|nr:TonB-dependent hemoglobin/transferrin/lactoferrin family receptor [Symploca sp. SIO2G7]
MLLMVAPAIAALEVESEEDTGNANAKVQLPIKDTLLIAQENASEVADNGGGLRITVTGTRTPRDVNDLPATVTVFELEDIEFYQSQDLRDLLRYEPGVSVRNNLRYGLQDVNIRGIEGNRVLFQLDNIRLPERFEFGPFNIGRGDYVDLATVQAVEVLRGPASTLYGSDALGGVVSFRSLEAADLLEPGDDFALELDSTYTSSSGGFDNFIRIGTRNEELESALVFSRRDSREVDTFASSDLTDGRDREGNTFYGNIKYLLNDTSSLSFIAEDFNRSTQTETKPANLSTFLGQQDFIEKILVDRTRFSLTYEYDDPDSPSFIQYARAQIFSQESTETERNLENRLSQGIPVFRDTENKFIADSYGGDVQLQSDFTTGNVNHRLTYGVDISTTFNARPRDRSQTDLTTGITTNVIPPDIFPVKDFPDGDTLRLGIYVQDEIEIGPFDLIAGLRFDHYDLDTSPDLDFARNGAESADLNESALSPHIALQYEATPELSFYGQYARGFRAPLYSEINSGFTNTTGRFFKYRTISNPDLEPETSNSFELGLRGNYDNFDFGLTGFYNTYDNFISTFESAGTECLLDVSPCPGFGPNGTAVVNIFQTQNIGEAEIYGVEFGGQYRMGDFSLIASLAWAEGNDTSGDDNIPLRTVDPFEAVVGLRYLDPSDKWRAELIGTFVGEPRLPDDATTFDPSAYVTVDLVGAYQFTPKFAMDFGVYNIFNEKYFIYSDVRNRPEDDPSIERFSQPGTNVRVGVNLTF